MTLLADWLNDRLAEMDISANQASALAGLNPGYISHVQRGGKLGVEGVRGLAKLFGVDYGLLLYLEDGLEIPDTQIANQVSRDREFAKIAEAWVRLGPAGRRALVIAAQSYLQSEQDARRRPTDAGG